MFDNAIAQLRFDTRLYGCDMQPKIPRLGGLTYCCRKCPDCGHHGQRRGVGNSGFGLPALLAFAVLHRLNLLRPNFHFAVLLHRLNMLRPDFVVLLRRPNLLRPDYHDAWARSHACRARDARAGERLSLEAVLILYYGPLHGTNV